MFSKNVSWRASSSSESNSECSSTAEEKCPALASIHTETAKACSKLQSAAPYLILAAMVLFCCIQVSTCRGTHPGNAGLRLLTLGPPLLAQTSQQSRKELDSQASSTTLSPTPPCQYGTLPGRWVGQRWAIFNQSCTMQALVSHAQAEAGSGGSQGILLIGDSVDRMVVELFCPVAFSFFTHPLAEEAPEFRCLICQTGGLTIANYPIWGIFSEGPYMEARQQTPQHRILTALELFQNRTGRHPDLVVLASNFWDIGAMRLRDKAAIDDQDELPAPMLNAWMRDAAAAMQLLDAHVPNNTVLVWQTRHYPAMADSITGRHKHDPLGRHAQVAQLNAAGRHVCLTRPRWQLVDVELMTSSFSDSHQYLRQDDNIHPNAMLAKATLNIYLNLLNQQQQQQQGAR